MVVVVTKPSDAAVAKPLTCIPKRASTYVPGLAPSSRRGVAKPHRQSAAVTYESRKLPPLARGAEATPHRPSFLASSWHKVRIRGSLKNLRRSLEPRSAERAAAPSRRMSLGLGRVNRKEKIVARFVLQLQLAVLKKATATMHLHLKDDPHTAHDLETRIGDWTLDGTFRQLNRRIFANAMVGLALGLYEMQIAWDAALKDGATQRIELIASAQGTILKLVLSASTLLLIKQLLTMYGLLVKEAHAMSGSAIFPQLPPPWPRHLVLRFALEVAVVAIHPPPFLDAYIHETASCMMFLRLYLVARVLRDHATVYQRRKDIVQNRFLNAQSPHFNWFFVVQIGFRQSPLLVIACTTITIWAALTTCIYELERAYQPHVFTLKNAAWFTYSLLTVHSPGFHPISSRGHIVAGILVLSGLLFETLMVVAVLQLIGLDAKDRVLLAYLQDTETRDALRHRARGVLRAWLSWRLAQRRYGGTKRVDRHEHQFWHAVERLHIVKNARELAAESTPIADTLSCVEGHVRRMAQTLRGPLCPRCHGVTLTKREIPKTLPSELRELQANYDIILAQQREMLSLLHKLSAAPS
ncbi:hypothetical protein SDRG_07162 [Saprolegnia diclina VS20]|uniref:Potassium channel domain-containing protein n=1 Tax=Saprolegnia diclina (strain VS20) TaxID=1156394 RepID=T0RYK7_SAPDV|nr:hypothetical protein SDRG_07162 [Saprolegnia diclina VS20]EQC35452.1 hypothetical protein SDRG_07162 [Saprolegnia diclina VS20]|eukprot:XP_008611202.1 hypothetical protein SDRG_07162 [Saprolegnia diclina VS20]